MHRGHSINFGCRIWPIKYNSAPCRWLPLAICDASVSLESSTDSALVELHPHRALWWTTQISPCLLPFSLFIYLCADGKSLSQIGTPQILFLWKAPAVLKSFSSIWSALQAFAVHFISHFSSHCLSICVKSSWIFIYNLAWVCSECSADSRCFVRTRTSCSQTFRWDSRLLWAEFHHTMHVKCWGYCYFLAFAIAFIQEIRLLMPCNA